jgi:hypothetical protein
MSSRKSQHVERTRSIFLAGSGRSGTTWVGDVLASCQGCCPIFEPLRCPQLHGVALGTPVEHEFPGLYLTPNAAHDDLQDYLQNIQDFRISTPWTRQDWRRIPSYIPQTSGFARAGYWLAETQYRRLKQRAARCVTKEIRANLLLTWLGHHFSTQIIFLTRHPCSVVGSRLRLQWPHDLTGVLSQPDLIRDYLMPFKDLIDSARSPIQQMAVLWCVENIVPLTQLKSRQWLTVSYEECLVSPRASFARLFANMQLVATRSTENALGKLVSAPLDSTLQQRQWFEPLTESEGCEVIEICENFGIYLYGRQSMPLCRHDASVKSSLMNTQ